jgi:hypothetical protein
MRETRMRQNMHPSSVRVLFVECQKDLTCPDPIARLAVTEVLVRRQDENVTIR